MDHDIRAITEDELPEYVAAVNASWGHHAGEDELEDARLLFEPGRCLGAFVGRRLVGGTTSLSLEVTVPGGAVLPAAGVTDAGVLPTHRRRGLYRELNAVQLYDARDRGDALGVLTASEGTIYGRFGYGVAAFSYAVEVARSGGAFADATVAARDVRLLEPDESALLLPGVFDRYRRRHPGEVSRSEALWDVLLRDRERWRSGGSARFVVAHEAPGGGVDGYVAYRMRADWRANLPDFDLAVDEVVALSPAVHAALWRYVLDVDLVGTVSAWNLPPDEPLRWLLADPRAYRVTAVHDMLWLRLVDVGAALAARRYASAGRVVLDVQDQFLPHNTGRYVVDDQAVARDPAATPDLSVRVADLGAAYLGGARFSTLARAGRVVEHTAGTVAVADAMFASDPLPHCATDF